MLKIIGWLKVHEGIAGIYSFYDLFYLSFLGVRLGIPVTMKQDDNGRYPIPKQQ
jgi:hypothetical protein